MPVIKINISQKLVLERALPILLYSTKFPEIKKFSVKLPETCINERFVTGTKWKLDRMPISLWE